MTTYKEIKGTQIEAVATDPSNPVEGQVWYNTTSNVLKGQGATTSGSWSTQNSMNTARQALGGSGSSTAALAFAGVGGGPTNDPQDVTELWNGTNWTEVNDLNTARGYVGGSGTSTSTLAFGGNSPNKTETELW